MPPTHRTAPEPSPATATDNGMVTPGVAVEVHHTPPQAAPLAPGAAVMPDWKSTLEMAKTLVPTGFLPAHIKTPAQALAIILTGREMGIGPMRALRSFSMVRGKVTENADSQLARFKSEGGRAQFKRLDETGAVLWLRHPNGDEHTETFALEDAKRAGLNGEDNYRKHPKAMFRSRAITAGLKSVGWEGSAGTYDPAELPPPVARDEAGEQIETGEVPTQAQQAFLLKLLRSSLWSDAERRAFTNRAEVSTKLQMTALVEEIVTEGKLRRGNAKALTNAETPAPVEGGVRTTVIDMHDKPPAGPVVPDPYIPGDAAEPPLPPEPNEPDEDDLAVDQSLADEHRFTPHREKR